MYLLFALGATLLTSFLPIVNKRLLLNAPPATVAFAINALSLPILAGGTFLFAECTFSRQYGTFAFSCVPHAPHVDLLFIWALLLSSALNWAATLLSTHALAKADVSLAAPLLTFNPAFTLLFAWLTLGEEPGVTQTSGVLIILLGAYLLEVKEARINIFDPLRTLARQPGALFAICASALWGITTVLEKLAIKHVSPSSGPVVALASTALTVVFLAPGAWLARRQLHQYSLPAVGYTAGNQRRALLIAVCISGIAPLFGFTAIALGLVGYVTALFKLSAVLTIVWARVFLGEGNIRQRLLGAGVMILGGALIAL